jgi:hypothetical protein
MSLKPKPGTITAELDREAVLNYQADYLARRFSLPLAKARSFVDRFGLDRRALNKAVQEQLMHARGTRSLLAAPFEPKCELPGRTSQRAGS